MNYLSLELGYFAVAFLTSQPLTQRCMTITGEYLASTLSTASRRLYTALSSSLKVVP